MVVSRGRMFVAAVILAAGNARRMGELKQVLPCRGEALVHRAARAALEAKLAPVVVVVGAEAERVARAVADLPVRIAYNPHGAEGQSTSVRAGLAALPTGVDGEVFLPADQPFITAEVLRMLVEGLNAGAQVVAPEVEGHITSPVLFSAALFGELAALEGDSGGRALFSRYPPLRISWHDPRLAVDVDSPEDYERWCGVERP